MSSITLVNESCADQDVDAIVNAANRHLLAGGGICGVIFKKAGYEELGNACRMINTPLNDGDAIITPAFNMNNTKYIIHAVGPNFNVNKDAFDILYNAYYNSLLLLKDNCLHSISFPLISSGIFAGRLDDPIGVSCKNCIKAYKDFISNYDYDIKVILCAYSNAEYKRCCEVFEVDL